MSNEFKISRQKLYEEIWDISTSKVAKKYNLSYNKLQQACKKANIPLPTQYYWGKYYAGTPVEKTPLPDSDILEVAIEKMTSRSFEKVTIDTEKVMDEKSKIEEESTDKNIPKEEMDANLSDEKENVANDNRLDDIPEKYKNKLQFLSEPEREKVFKVACALTVNPNKHLHKALKKHKEDVIAWGKKYPYDETKTRKRDMWTRTSAEEPLLYRDIALDSLQRTCKILNTLFDSVEKLGGKVNDDLTLVVRNEKVSFSIVESENKVAHVWTKKETEDYQKYEKAKKENRYAWEPKIRKWDFMFNGKLRFIVPVGIEIRDTDAVQLEECVGDILVALYEESENSRIIRIAREEKVRKEEEERKIREEKRQRYDLEVDKTMALVNEAEDYAIACKIRAYIESVEEKRGENITHEIKEWLMWAKEKADWYDPTVKREDEHLGVRQHSKDVESKKLKKSRSYYW